MWISLLLLEVVMLGAMSAGHAAEPGLVKKSGESPAVATTITSKKMTVRNQENQAIFEGTVVLTRGTLVVYSDRMVVLFQSQGTEAASSPNSTPSKGTDGVPAVSSRSVSRIEATGHVKIENGNSNATCEKAVYFTDEEKIVLTGDPVAWERGTRVSGKQITVYLTEERSVVEGGTHVRIEGEGKNTP
jgi:lipopolysaccharide export system protein LptA